MTSVTAACALFLCAGFASGGLTPEGALYGGSLTFDYATGAQIDNPIGLRSTLIYDNITGGVGNGGFSSTDLTSVWGDRLLTLGTGTLQEFGFTVFNSATGNTGNVLTANVTVSFFRAADSSFLGGFNGNVTFGAGLNAGFFTSVNFTNLGGLGIDLDTNDIIVTQTVNTFSGTSTRLGVVSLNPLLPGTSSPTSIYVDSATIGGGVPGFYNFGNPIINANVGYRAVVPTPASAALIGLGGLLAARRRR